jgi:hypothetical protein
LFSGNIGFPISLFPALAVYETLSFPPPLHSSFPNFHLFIVCPLTALFAYSTSTTPLAAGYNPNTSPATN